MVFLIRAVVLGGMAYPSSMVAECGGDPARPLQARLIDGDAGPFSWLISLIIGLPSLLAVEPSNVGMDRLRRFVTHLPCVANRLAYLAN
ncbi:hypothetical protein RchiOBHm_Chr3g0469041 [Rosa chinensis]|uniref:Uncharacterized protein n=1 Tax=Rosa chinensis TaxID=74649 RepID=A0A2P6RAM5_ROSCH|nr:hypothetical protein RchiOBHm_Chr3g0469041 [Rosa chinensis]